MYQDAALNDTVLTGTGADIEVGLALGKRARDVGGGNDAQVEAHALGEQAGDIGVVTARLALVVRHGLRGVGHVHGNGEDTVLDKVVCSESRLDGLGLDLGARGRGQRTTRQAHRQRACERNQAGHTFATCNELATDHLGTPPLSMRPLRPAPRTPAHGRADGSYHDPPS